MNYAEFRSKYRQLKDRSDVCPHCCEWTRHLYRYCTSVRLLNDERLRTDFYECSVCNCLYLWNRHSGAIKTVTPTLFPIIQDDGKVKKPKKKAALNKGIKA